MTNNVTEKQHTNNLTATETDGVKCELDGVWVHSIPAYLTYLYPDMTVEQYQAQFDGAALYSPKLLSAKAQQASAAAPAAGVTVNASAAVVHLHPAGEPIRKSFSDVFELGGAKAAKNKRGDEIMIDVLTDPETSFLDYVPEVDPNYIYNIDNLKSVMMAIQINKPMLAWGLHGTGKTTLFEQYAARTNRPFLRVQHTVSTEESHVLGQYVVRDGDTVFEPGPLAVAMRFGLIYCADEYDFALPSVTSVYQPVLEGKNLLIKEAPPEWRVVKPHKNFRFVATGNTNGGGDDTGLYQGTQMQNAANYSRFAITIRVDYMPEKQEIAVVAAQGGIHQDDAKKLVELADHVRKSYSQGDISVTISPRELINAATWGRVLGAEWKKGLELAYTNRLNNQDRLVVENMMQRIFA